MFHWDSGMAVMSVAHWRDGILVTQNRFTESLYKACMVCLRSADFWFFQYVQDISDDLANEWTVGDVIRFKANIVNFIANSLCLHHCDFGNVMMIFLGLNSEGDGQYKSIIRIAVKLALAKGAKDIHCECLLLYWGTKWTSPCFLCPACQLIGQGSVIKFRM